MGTHHVAYANSLQSPYWSATGRRPGKARVSCAACRTGPSCLAVALSHTGSGVACFTCHFPFAVRAQGRGPPNCDPCATFERKRGREKTERAVTLSRRQTDTQHARGRVTTRFFHQLQPRLPWVVCCEHTGRSGVCVCVKGR